MKRREFVQTASFAAVGLLSLPSFLAAAKAQKPLGLQLYTLRSTIDKDPKGVLTKVAALGYKNLEAYGYKEDGTIFGMDYTEFNKFVKGLGMQIVSGHYGYDLTKSANWQKTIDNAKKNGQEYIVVPSLPESEHKDLDGFKRVCEQLNKAGEACNKSGIRFGYHNHAFEFQEMEGQIPYDVMLKELDAKNVGMEMDIFWVVNAGFDPLKYFAKYPGRFEQWHVKDMDKGDKGRNADVGTGTIDYKAIFAQASQSGMKRWYVEQETYPGEPIDSAAASAKYLKTIL